jgi:hypothetical protein
VPGGDPVAYDLAMPGSRIFVYLVTRPFYYISIIVPVICYLMVGEAFLFP